MPGPLSATSTIISDPDRRAARRITPQEVHVDPYLCTYYYEINNQKAPFTDAREMVQKAGMSYTLRSTGEIPSNSTQVVIGDTMGELMLLYGIADLAFVGGSLVERGGHNPLEPAAHAIPVLMGPHTFNFKDICAKLQQDDGLITVTDADSLVTEVSNLLTDEDYRLWYGRHAVEVLHQNQGALSRLLQLLQPYLPQRSH